MKIPKPITLLSLIGLSLISYSYSFAEDWNSISFEREATAPQSETIIRNRFKVQRNYNIKDAPNLNFQENSALAKARQIRIDEKTNELILQLEALWKREGQSERSGEIRMRLAEMYFDRAQAVAVGESSEWEQALKTWEALPVEQRTDESRPKLKTPKADALRGRAKVFYEQMERESRTPDQGRSKMIRRDEVLYFLGSTLVAQGKFDAALGYLSEYENKYSNGVRIYSIRLQYGDILFDRRKFADAIPLYLKCASGEGLQPGEDSEALKSYSLYKLAWSYFSTNAFDKAILAFQRSIEESRKSQSERRLGFEREALLDLVRTYALAGRFSDGEKYFLANTKNPEPFMIELWQQSADLSRDRGSWDSAEAYYKKLIEKNPEALGAREYALEIVELQKKQNDHKGYAEALGVLAEKYGANSDWMDERTSEEREYYIDDTADRLRKEAKFYHDLAQKQKKINTFKTAIPFYEVYFKYVPEPNKDSPENVHEMRFFQGELLYQVGRYEEAAKAYELVGEGKYKKTAAYAAIVAWQEQVKKNKKGQDELFQATKRYLKENPNDANAADLLYQQAFDSFQKGSSSESLEVLEKLVTDYSATSKGPEAAERILFVLEKNQEKPEVIREKAQEFLKNSALIKTGGKAFETKIKDIALRTEFKAIEAMPEGSSSEALSKSEKYFELYQSSTVSEIRKKALNNSYLLAQKSENPEWTAKLLVHVEKELPDSPYVTDIYFSKAQLAAQSGRWQEALSLYTNALKKSPKNTAVEAAEWNRILLMAHLEDVWTPRLSPTRSMSAGLKKSLVDFVQKFPKNVNRSSALESLLYDKSMSLVEAERMERSGKWSSLERGIFSDAKSVLIYRSGSQAQKKDLLKKNPAARLSSSTPRNVREALGLMAFQATDSEFQSYKSLKLNSSNSKNLVKTLNIKIAALEKIEKLYTQVVLYKGGESAFRSLSRLNEVYMQLAADLGKIKLANAEEKQVLETQFVLPLQTKADGFLKTCRTTAVEIKYLGRGDDLCGALEERGLWDFDQVIFSGVQWPSEDASSDPLWKVALGHLKKGEWSLAELSILLSTQMKSEEKILLGALAAWKQNLGSFAYQKLMSLLDSANSGVLWDYKNFAIINLALIEQQFGNHQKVYELLEPTFDNSFEEAVIFSLSARRAGKTEDALKAIDKAQNLAKNKKNEMALTFNKALVYATQESWKEASRVMGDYIDEAKPAPGDISRKLYSQWKGRLK